MPITPSGIEP